MRWPFCVGENPMHFVYIITYVHKGERKYYIGETNNILRRLKQHKSYYKNILLTEVSFCGLMVVSSRRGARMIEKLLQPYKYPELKELFIKAGGQWVDELNIS